ncbi:cell envelope integrity protein TolA [Amphritea balenae]|uniref:cell envelope integrity protein TolA n=1 Tax=Amphritea balenae TaxID=452629 RepID=UPI0014743AC3|nr:cell envelope integrity protein TolA [Amphritea balenae]GGK61131.1 hypothetical protein GCM10007941_09180 [Amphritea balenae]
MNFRSYLLPTLLALILHSVIFSALFYSWFGYAEDQRQLTPRHVKAQIVDIKTQLKAQQQKKQAEARKKEDARKQEAQKKAEARKKADAKKKEDARKKAEARKKEDARKKAEASKKAAAKKKEDARIKAEAKKKAEARKKAEAQKKAAAQKKQEALKKAEAEKKEAARLQAEKDRKEQERKEQARRDAELDAQLAAEEQELQAEADQQSVAGYRDYIANEIERNWRRPPSARNGMKVLLALHLLPTGEVDNVYIVTSSGNGHFDESAIRAVKRVGRFSELQKMESVLFDRYYRKFNLEFIPTDLRR